MTTLPAARQSAEIVSANLARRNPSKGQQAMLYAVAYPEPEKGGRGHKGKASETDGFSATRLKVARTVLRKAPDLVPLVAAGSMPLDQAYEAAHRLDQEADVTPTIRTPQRARGRGGLGSGFRASPRPAPLSPSTSARFCRRRAAPM